MCPPSSVPLHATDVRVEGDDVLEESLAALALGWEDDQEARD
jgi:hypothetical protein